MTTRYTVITSIPNLLKNGFKYHSTDVLTYVFPTYKHDNKPVIYGRLNALIEDGEAVTMTCNAFTESGNTYPINNDYGISDVVEIVKKNINKKILELSHKDVKFEKKRYKKSKKREY